MDSGFTRSIEKLCKTGVRRRFEYSLIKIPNCIAFDPLSTLCTHERIWSRNSLECKCATGNACNVFAFHWNSEQWCILISLSAPDGNADCRYPYFGFVRQRTAPNFINQFQINIWIIRLLSSGMIELFINCVFHLNYSDPIESIDWLVECWRNTVLLQFAVFILFALLGLPTQFPRFFDFTPNFLGKQYFGTTHTPHSMCVKKRFALKRPHWFC